MQNYVQYKITHTILILTNGQVTHCTVRSFLLVFNTLQTATPFNINTHKHTSVSTD